MSIKKEGRLLKKWDRVRYNCNIPLPLSISNAISFIEIFGKDSSVQIGKFLKSIHHHVSGLGTWLGPHIAYNNERAIRQIHIHRDAIEAVVKDNPDIMKTLEVFYANYDFDASVKDLTPLKGNHNLKRALEELLRESGDLLDELEVGGHF